MPNENPRRFFLQRKEFTPKTEFATRHEASIDEVLAELRRRLETCEPDSEEQYHSCTLEGQERGWWSTSIKVFVVQDPSEPLAEPDGLEYIRTRDFLLDLAERHQNGEADSIDREITDFFDGNGSLVCLTIAARHHGENPAVAKVLDEIKTALLAD